MERINFWKGKRVLITGHTGFKGTWLAIFLQKLGATIIGYSLETYPNDLLFNQTKISEKIIDVRGDIKDYDHLQSVFNIHSPEIVFHLAAQPLVRKSYEDCLGTLNTNIMGTTNIPECIKQSHSVKVAIIITSDKCYKNKEWVWGYKENDELGGADPYSCSKACSELITESYRQSFFKHQNKLVATVRAGNVIGGGDYSEDRLVPDCIKALKKHEDIIVRNPYSTRPWQHVLEPLGGYILLAEKMWTEKKYDEAWNFGPMLSSIRTVRDLVDVLLLHWGSGTWVNHSTNDFKHEANLLSLDISKSNFLLGWKPILTFEDTVKYTVEWYKHTRGNNAYDLCLKQIEEYLKKCEE